jgi:hypothetical protein
MAWKLPGLEASVGTAAQPAPKVAIVSVADAEGAALIIGEAGAVVAAAELLSPLELPQAASEMEKRAAAATAVIFVARMEGSLRKWTSLDIRDETTCGWAQLAPELEKIGISCG